MGGWRACFGPVSDTSTKYKGKTRQCSVFKMDYSSSCLPRQTPLSHCTVYGQRSQVCFWSWPLKKQFTVHLVRKGLITLAEKEALKTLHKQRGKMSHSILSLAVNKKARKKANHETYYSTATPTPPTPQGHFTVRLWSQHCKLTTEFGESLIPGHGLYLKKKKVAFCTVCLIYSLGQRFGVFRGLWANMKQRGEEF